MRKYSLRKCRRILRTSFKLFQRKKHRLGEHAQKQYETDLRSLDQAILNKNKLEASTLSHKIETFNKENFPKSFFDHGRELTYALSFAIVVAFFIRQFWFELYEVPTGSMRPTVEELDRMVVSKTTFGIHWPFRMKPFLFSEDFIQRSGIIVFTVENMDIADADMLYFNLIPGKKRYIKRCIAKPGDIIYFYGGKIYAIDSEDNPLLLQADPHWLRQIGIEKIDHVPYISLDGKSKVSKPTSSNIFGAVTLNQMNLPIGKLEIKSKGEIQGLFFNGKEWGKENINALKSSHNIPESYSDLWGIGNYAMARLLTKKQARQFYSELPEGNEEGILYLELRHTPNLTYPKPELRQSEMGVIEPMITPFITLIPLTTNHLKTLQKNLYTARFYVKNGQAYRYHESKQRVQSMQFDPRFPKVPDGCYEFYYGVGYQVHFGGVRTKLPSTHPLYSSEPEMIQKLFNLGISFNNLFEPMAPNQPYVPQRFAYYRDENLYVMGAPLLKKNDPTLLDFVHKELKRQSDSTQEKPYIAFIDHGPPLNEDGSLNIPFIKAFGLKVPFDGLVALGDNYAMSADSRDFGFVPIENLRGAPSFTFWPPSNRLGSLPQPSYPIVTAPNLIVWSVALIIIILTILWIRNRNRQSIFKE